MEDGKMMNILYEDNHVLVCVKPMNIPAQADNSKDLDLLTLLKQYMKEKYQKPGNVYLGLVHRLDRPVSGIMVFAKTSKAASRLSEQVRNHTFQKEYHAVVENDIENIGKYHDYLLKDTKTNITKVDSKGKEAILTFEKVKYDKKTNLSLVKIHLKTGRSHQIRVQFSHHNHPLYGDQKYNQNAKVGQQIALCATGITFIHPTTKESMNFQIPLSQNYPWNVF